MKYLKVSRWDEWQTYRKDRSTPPWIKVYRNLLTNPEWITLTDAEKGQLISIWIVAADKKGQIPADAKVLQKMAMLDEPPNLDKLISLGFLVAKRLPKGCQLVTEKQKSDAPETETETEIEKHIVHFDSESAFEEIWPDYPKLVGKEAAKKHFLKAIKSEEDFSKIRVALKNYKAHVNAERIKGFKDLNWQGGSRWFNPREWTSWIAVAIEEYEQRPLGAAGVAI